MALTPLIKQAAMDAMDASKPTQFLFGTVNQVSPMVVSVDTTLKLRESDGALKIAYSLTRHTELVTYVNEEGKKDSQTVTVESPLKVGDRVILGRMQGGQTYIVLDKVG